MNTYKPKDFAKMLGVTVRTLQKWDVAGKLKAFRTPTNRRFYTQEQLDVYMGNSTRVQNQKKVILYARVSTVKQRDDLKNQVSFLREFVNARGVIVDRVMTDIGSGLNLKRKQWNELIKMAEEGKVAEIYIAHKDRFVRFGFDWFERRLAEHGAKIIVVNNEDLSPEREIIQDLISIIRMFSIRIHGLGKYEGQLKGDETIAQILQDRTSAHRKPNG